MCYPKIWGWPEDFENLTENPGGTQNMGTRSPEEFFFPQRSSHMYIYLNAKDCVVDLNYMLLKWAYHFYYSLLKE